MDKNKLGNRVSKEVTGSMNVGRSHDDFGTNGRFLSKNGMDFEEENKDGVLKLHSKNSDSSSSVMNID
jgi:hypothetical protein